MKQNPDITSLEELVRTLGRAGSGQNRVSIGTLLEVVGRSSFGPVLVMAGILAVSPLSGIPGMPTFVAVIVLLTAGQLLFGRNHLWLPGWVSRRTVPRRKLKPVLRRAKPAVRFVDRLFRPRLTVLTGRVGAYVVAVLCLAIALVMPPMELIPFSATTAGAALTMLGLGLISQDGLMTLIAVGFTLGMGALLALVAF